MSGGHWLILLIGIGIVALGDWDWLRPRTADLIVDRIRKRAAAGDIIVMHDGDESAPRKTSDKS
jgi:hypothetical protein